MNKSIHRMRRWVVTAMAATTLLSTGVILGTAGIAGAAGAKSGSITASSAPTVFHSVIDQPAGDLTISLGPLDEVIQGDVIEIDVGDNSGSFSHIAWTGVPTVTANNVFGDTPVCIEGEVCSGPSGTAPYVSGDALFITLNGNSGGGTITPGQMPNPQTITLTNIHYNVGPAAAVGPVEVEGFYDVNNTFNFSPYPPVVGAGNSATNAVVAGANAAPTVDLNAVTTPALAIGGSNQTAGSWNLGILSSGPGAQISDGDTINLIIGDHNDDDCVPGTLANPDSLGFAATPSIDVTAGVGVATAVPTATVAVSAVNDGTSHCGGTSVENLLTITFTNTTPVLITSTTHDTIEIQITGVKYNVSGGAKIIADQGTVAVADNYDISGVNALPAFVGGSTIGVVGHGPSNGDIGAITVNGNTPPSDIQLNVTSNLSGSEAVNQPISPITLTEDFPGSLPSGTNGFVCVSLITGGEWDATTTAPTVAATNGMTVGPVSVETSGPFAGDSTLEFQVTGGSTTGPAVLTLSNLDVSVSQNLLTDIVNGLVLVTTGGTNASCLSGSLAETTATKVFSVSGRIYGNDADGTAAQAFAVANPGGNDDAVLATDTDPYDALSASYLAGQTSTGVLLTPTAAVSSETLSALRIAGVETVYAVGGPDAISQAAITQLEATPSYLPGGTVQRYDPFTNDEQLLDVQWIYGSTADGTASQTAQYVGNFPLGQPEVQAGYGGMYNDTSGSSGSSASSAPDAGVNTAIIATDTGFQDAASASVMADANHLPLILSPEAALSSAAIAALQNDGIQQAFVMGGPDVISDAVLTQLEGMGISVLRIAGSDYTDTSAKAAAFEINDTNAAGQFDGLGYSTSVALGLPAIIGVNLQSLSFARGDFYSDAIVSSQINAFLESPELLTENPTTLGAPVTSFLGTEGNPATAFGQSFPAGSGFSLNEFSLVGGQAIFGGPAALSSTVETAIATAIGPDQIPFP